MKIYHERKIEIDAPVADVFRYIETMPDKFPTCDFFDAAPIMFVRMALVDGVASAARSVRGKARGERGVQDHEILEMGSTMGPFTLSQVIPPEKYYFTIDSLFFRGETGYRLVPFDGRTHLYFECGAKDPSVLERVWWMLVRPAHHVLAGIVLRNIRRGVGDTGRNGRA